MIQHWSDLGQTEKDRLSKFFRKQIFPVLTPLAVDPAHPFSTFRPSLNLAVLVRATRRMTRNFCAGEGPPALAAFYRIDSEGRPYRPEDVPADEHGKTTYIPLEEVIGAHLEALFPGHGGR